MFCSERKLVVISFSFYLRLKWDRRCGWNGSQVHLSTHDAINKNTAKASLQQMLSVVFARMETKDKKLKEVSKLHHKTESFCENIVQVVPTYAIHNSTR